MDDQRRLVYIRLETAKSGHLMTTKPTAIQILREVLRLLDRILPTSQFLQSAQLGTGKGG